MTKAVSAIKTVLGIESTAHTFGIGIARSTKGKREILANQLAKFPTTGKGYLPRELAEHHAEKYSSLVSAALQEAKISFSDLSAIAYSQGPGMGHCLETGYSAALDLSTLLKIPLIPVNHAVAHVQIVRHYSPCNDPLIVYVSGGNTQILFRQGKRFHVLGETLDIGLGNFLDQLGRVLKLVPPDAVGVLTEAATPGAKLIEFPYVVKGMSTSYSGMLTYIQRLARQHSASDICFSAQETSFAALCEASERALLHSRKNQVLLCGGNGRNRRLQQMVRLMAEGQNASFHVGPDPVLGDNAAMIAYTGLLQFEAGKISRHKTPVQDQRIDSVDVVW